MAFQGLSERLQAVMGKLRKKGKVTESDVREAMREVRLALLEADVHFKVVKMFVDRVKERAIGQEVLRSLTPGQQVIKVVHEELTWLMGEEQAKLTKADQPPTVILMAGLQGAGKTTSCGKLASYLMKQKHRVLLVACDVYRPAAIRQLEIVGEQIQAPVFSLGTEKSPLEIVEKALLKAKEEKYDYMIVDTAGRLHVDEGLMDELKGIKGAIHPDEVLLVMDAMTGQDAVNVAEVFHQEVGLTGVILTKLDGDARGGAALSVKYITQCPIKFVGTGEKTDALEPFHPDRMANRILGMGDVLSLIEKAEQAVDEEKARDFERKIRKQTFTLEDFLEQLQQMKKMGPLEEVMAMFPGADRMKGMKPDEKQVQRIEAIIFSMTPKERMDPAMINASRRKRIALGSGTTVPDVNRLLKQFTDMKKMMKDLTRFMGGGGKKKKGRFGLPFFN